MGAILVYPSDLVPNLKDCILVWHVLLGCDQVIRSTTMACSQVAFVGNREGEAFDFATSPCKVECVCCMCVCVRQRFVHGNIQSIVYVRVIWILFHCLC